MRRIRVVGIVVVVAILAGCGGGKKGADPTTTVASNAASTTTTVESVGIICAKLLTQDHSLRTSLSDAIQKLKAARATNPKSSDAQTFATERVQIQRALADVDALLGRMRKVNGPSVCP